MRQPPWSSKSFAIMESTGFRDLNASGLAHHGTLAYRGNHEHRQHHGIIGA